MSAIDDIIKFIANHLVAIVIIGAVVGGIFIFFSFTETGQAGWKLLMEQPIYLVLLAALLAAPLGVYLWMLRPQDSEARRAPPEEVWNAVRRRYGGYFRNGSLPRQIRRDKLEGLFFTGRIFDDFRTTIMVCDTHGKRLGMIFDVFGSEKDDTNIDTRLKRGLSAEERLQRISQDKKWLESVQNEDRRMGEAESLGMGPQKK